MKTEKDVEDALRGFNYMVEKNLHGKSEDYLRGVRETLEWFLN